MPFVRQTSFLGGELSPTMWGRSDLSAFGKGLRTMRNFFPSRQGAAVSRAGTAFCAPAMTGPSGAAGLRLIPFVFSDAESFVIEMGVVSSISFLYFRPFAHGEPLQAQRLALKTVTGPFRAGEVVTGGTSGATATILAVAPAYAGHKASLQLANISGTFVDDEAVTDSDDGVAVADGAVYLGAVEVFVPAASGTDLREVRYAQVGDILTLTHPLWSPLELRRLPDVDSWAYWTVGNVQLTPPDTRFEEGYYPALKSPLPTADPTHPAREWAWMYTITAQDVATGTLFETKARRITETWDGVLANSAVALSAGALIALYVDMPVTILQDLHSGGYSALPDESYRAISINYYRGRGKLLGFIGTTDTLGGATTSVPFVDTGAEPNYAIQPPLGTNPFLTYDYDQVLVLPVEYPYAVAFFQERRVFGGTHRRPSTLFFSATGDYRNYDSHFLIPISGQSLLYEIASRRFEEVMHLFDAERLLVFTKSSVYTFAGAGGAALDFDSVDCQLVDGVGSTNVPPLRIDDAVLFARAKGTGVRALAMDQGGYYRGSDISAMATHLFAGLALDYSGSRRLVDWTYAEDPWGLVWAARDDGVLLSLTLSAESAGWARHDTDGRVTGVCAIPEDDEDRVYLLVEREIDSQTVTYVERMASRVRRGNTYDDDVCVDASVQFASLSGSPAFGATVTGLTHLIGKEVYVTAVGFAPLGPFLVNAEGEIQIPAPVPEIETTISVGLPFTADLETLDVVTTDTRVKQKTVVSVGFELDETAGIQTGPDFEHLSESEAHTVTSGYNAPSAATGLVRVNVRGKWDESARAVLRQTLPLPVTVVGIVRETEVGG